MRRVLLLALLMCGAAYAYAGPTQFTFLSYTGGDWQNGYPYYITSGPASQLIAVMCDDYLHGGSVGETWQANVTDLGSGNISLTRFDKFVAGPTALTPLFMYDEAGWILLQTITEPSSEWKDMNYAVWNLFDPASPCDTDCMAWLQAAEQEGKIGFPGIDFDKVYIVTPLNQYNPDPNSIQEFMYIGADPTGQGGNNQTTPEPGTLLLLGTGAVALFRRKLLG